MSFFFPFNGYANGGPFMVAAAHGAWQNEHTILEGEFPVSTAYIHCPGPLLTTVVCEINEGMSFSQPISISDSFQVIRDWEDTNGYDHADFYGVRLEAGTPVLFPGHQPFCPDPPTPTSPCAPFDGTECAFQPLGNFVNYLGEPLLDGYQFVADGVIEFPSNRDGGPGNDTWVVNPDPRWPIPDAADNTFGRVVWQDDQLLAADDLTYNIPFMWDWHAQSNASWTVSFARFRVVQWPPNTGPPSTVIIGPQIEGTRRPDRLFSGTRVP